MSIPISGCLHLFTLVTLEGELAGFVMIFKSELF